VSKSIIPIELMRTPLNINFKGGLGKPSQKKNGETWEKVQTSFTPSLPPSTWEPLTVIFFYCIFGL